MRLRSIRLGGMAHRGAPDARRVARRSLAMISYAVRETAMETWRRGERRHRRHSPWPGQPERRAATRRCCRRVRKATSKAVFCIGVGRLSRPKAKAVQSWPSIWSASQFSAWRTPLSMAGWAGTGQSRERPGCRSAGNLDHQVLVAFDDCVDVGLFLFILRHAGYSVSESHMTCRLRCQSMEAGSRRVDRPGNGTGRPRGSPHAIRHEGPQLENCGRADACKSIRCFRMHRSAHRAVSSGCQTRSRIWP